MTTKTTNTSTMTFIANGRRGKLSKKSHRRHGINKGADEDSSENLIDDELSFRDSDAFPISSKAGLLRSESLPSTNCPRRSNLSLRRSSSLRAGAASRRNFPGGSMLAVDQENEEEDEGKNSDCNHRDVRLSFSSSNPSSSPSSSVKIEESLNYEDEGESENDEEKDTVEEKREETSFQPTNMNTLWGRRRRRGLGRGHPDQPLRRSASLTEASSSVLETTCFEKYPPSKKTTRPFGRANTVDSVLTLDTKRTTHSIPTGRNTSANTSTSTNTNTTPTIATRTKKTRNSRRKKLISQTNQRRVHATTSPDMEMLDSPVTRLLVNDEKHPNLFVTTSVSSNNISHVKKKSISIQVENLEVGDGMKKRRLYGGNSHKNGTAETDICSKRTKRDDKDITVIDDEDDDDKQKAFGEKNIMSQQVSETRQNGVVFKEEKECKKAIQIGGKNESKSTSSSNQNTIVTTTRFVQCNDNKSHLLRRSRVADATSGTTSLTITTNDTKEAKKVLPPKKLKAIRTVSKEICDHKVLQDQEMEYQQEQTRGVGISIDAGSSNNDDIGKLQEFSHNAARKKNAEHSTFSKCTNDSKTKEGDDASKNILTTAANNCFPRGDIGDIHEATHNVKKDTDTLPGSRVRKEELKPQHEENGNGNDHHSSATLLPLETMFPNGNKNHESGSKKMEKICEGGEGGEGDVGSSCSESVGVSSNQSYFRTENDRVLSVADGSVSKETKKQNPTATAKTSSSTTSELKSRIGIWTSIDSLGSVRSGASHSVRPPLVEAHRGGGLVADPSPFSSESRVIDHKATDAEHLLDVRSSIDSFQSQGSSEQSQSSLFPQTPVIFSGRRRRKVRRAPTPENTTPSNNNTGKVDDYHIDSVLQSSSSIKRRNFLRPPRPRPPTSSETEELTNGASWKLLSTSMTSAQRCRKQLGRTSPLFGDDNDDRRAVVAVGDTDVYAMQDAGSFLLGYEHCAYLCSTLLSSSSVSSSLSTVSMTTATTACELASLLSDAKRRAELLPRILPSLLEALARTTTKTTPTASSSSSSVVAPSRTRSRTRASRRTKAPSSALGHDDAGREARTMLKMAMAAVSYFVSLEARSNSSVRNTVLRHYRGLLGMTRLAVDDDDDDHVNRRKSLSTHQSDVKNDQYKESSPSPFSPSTPESSGLSFASSVPTPTSPFSTSDSYSSPAVGVSVLEEKHLKEALSRIPCFSARKAKKHGDHSDLHFPPSAQQIALRALATIISRRRDEVDDEPNDRPPSSTNTDDNDDEDDDDGDCNNHNDPFLANRSLRKSGALQVLGDSMVQLLRTDNVSRQHDWSRLSNLTDLIDDACCLSPKNRRLLVEETDLMDALLGHCGVNVHVKGQQLHHNNHHHHHHHKNDDCHDAHAESSLRSFCLRILTSLTHENPSAGRALFLGGGDNEDADFPIDVDGKPPCCGFESIYQLLRRLASNEQSDHDSIVYCLNVLANVAECPTWADDARRAFKYSGVSWLTSWLVDRTKGRLREAIVTGTDDGGVTVMETLLVVGNGFVLLACLMLGTDSSSLSTIHNTNGDDTHRHRHYQHNYENDINTNKNKTVTVTTHDIRRTVLTHTKLIEASGGQGGSGPVDFIVKTLKAFLNFYHYSIGDLSVAVVEPVMKLIDGLKQIPAVS